MNKRLTARAHSRILSIIISPWQRISNGWMSKPIKHRNCFQPDFIAKLFCYTN